MLVTLSTLKFIVLTFSELLLAIQKEMCDIFIFTLDEFRVAETYLNS
jgi:hypothetical protein